jgi:hypothetical protein
MDSLEKHNAICEKTCKQFLQQFTTLIDIFAELIENDCITTMRKNWVMIKRLLSAQEIVDQCGEYFIFFEKKILEDDCEYMVNYDYSSLVISGTAETTKTLIKNLTDNILVVWNKKDENVNKSIVATTKNLVKLAVIHKKVMDKIGNLEI